MWRCTTIQQIPVKGIISNALQERCWVPLSLFWQDDFNLAAPESMSLSRLYKITFGRLAMLMRLSELYRRHHTRLLENPETEWPQFARFAFKSIYSLDFGEPLFVGWAGDQPEADTGGSKCSSYSQSSTFIPSTVDPVDPPACDLEDNGGVQLSRRRRVSYHRPTLPPPSSAPRDGSVISAGTGGPSTDRFSAGPSQAVRNYADFDVVKREEIISHMLLRYTWAGNRTREEWLVQQEGLLAQVRVQLIWELARSHNFDLGMPGSHSSHPTELELTQMLREHLGLPCEMCNVTEEEAALDPHLLKAGCMAFKTPLVPEVADLLRRRRITLAKGSCFVPLDKLPYIVSCRLRNCIRAGCADAGRRAASTQPMLRQTAIRDLVEHLARVDPLSSLESNVGGNKNRPERLSPSILMRNAQESFPLCMVHLLGAVRAHRHLRCHGRLQLWWYLKDCGMTCDEQIQVFRQLWTDQAKFDKEHVYNLRHFYGLEGKKQEKRGFTCDGICGAALPRPRSGEFHGCPYRDLPKDKLEVYLRQCHLGNLEVEEVMARVRNHEYQAACRVTFERRHPGVDAEAVGRNPLDYYDESRRYWLAQRRVTGKGEPAAGTSTPTNLTGRTTSENVSSGSKGQDEVSAQ